MLSKHVDAIALLVIVLGLLVFSKAPEFRIVRDAQGAPIRIQNALNRLDPCPLSEALIPHFRFR